MAPAPAAPGPSDVGGSQQTSRDSTRRDSKHLTQEFSIKHSQTKKVRSIFIVAQALSSNP